VEQEQPPTNESIPALVSRLIDDGEGFVRAELKLYRARLVSRLDDVRNAIIFVVIALSLVQAVMVAALVGLLIVLRPLIGPGGATGMVVVAGLGVAGLLAFLAWRLLLKTSLPRRKRTPSRAGNNSPTPSLRCNRGSSRARWRGMRSRN